MSSQHAWRCIRCKSEIGFYDICTDSAVCVHLWEPIAKPPARLCYVSSYTALIDNWDKFK